MGRGEIVVEEQVGARRDTLADPRTEELTYHSFASSLWFERSVVIR